MLARTVIAALLTLAGTRLQGQTGSLHGRLTDPQGQPVAGGEISIVRGGSQSLITRSDSEGNFVLDRVAAGTCEVIASAPGFVDTRQSVNIARGAVISVNLQFERLAPQTDAVTVIADVQSPGIQNPDPAQRVMVRENFLTPTPAARRAGLDSWTPDRDRIGRHQGAAILRSRRRRGPRRTDRARSFRWAAS